ncbi:MAG: hypothetical protein HY343_11355 [Lentisphaerae bacterium]|nr:hypothetical protein [Lentisphaerota bacterium]
MAWRIHNQVARGVIDSRHPGRVVGSLWLAGREEPIRLDLEGDPLRDLAGCLLTFENPHPEAGELDTFAALQSGKVGDMTASRKARVPDVTVEEMARLCREGQPFPWHLANILYLEWFSESNGRVVIEAADWRVTVSLPEWRMTPDQEREQADRNRAAMGGFLEAATGPVDDADDCDPEADKPMDEFQWEKFMKESDARSERYRQVLEKYEGHPDQEKLVAREMGWNWLDDALDAKERGGVFPPDDEADPFADAPPLEPDPATEGVDWVRDPHGHPQHPLTLRATDTAMAMYHKCDARGLLGEAGDADLHAMIFEAQTAGVKLAGALNSLCYRGEHSDPGFIVAYLKRALTYLHAALAAVSRVEPKNLLPVEDLAAYRTELHAIRVDILALMKRSRGRLNY